MCWSTSLDQSPNRNLTHSSSVDDTSWNYKGYYSSCNWVILLPIQKKVVDAIGNRIQRRCLLLSAVLLWELSMLHFKRHPVHKCSDLEFLSNSLMARKGSCSKCNILAITEPPIYSSWVFGTEVLKLEATISEIQYLKMWLYYFSKSRWFNETAH